MFETHVAGINFMGIAASCWAKIVMIEKACASFLTCQKPYLIMDFRAF